MKKLEPLEVIHIPSTVSIFLSKKYLLITSSLEIENDVLGKKIKNKKNKNLMHLKYL